MSEEIRFSVEELTSYAGKLGSLSGKVGGTVSSALQPPNQMMYGLLMSPIVAPVLGFITASAGSFLRGTVNAVNASRDQMDETRKAYHDTEERNVEAAKTIVA